MKLKKHQSYVIALALAAITLAVFWRVLGHGFLYDDSQYILENRNIQGGLTWDAVKWAFGSSYAGNWHPLTWLSHALDWQLYGPKPMGHHLTNLLLHLANVLLLFLVLSRMTGSFWKSGFAAALFAIHPLRVESVAWVSERKDVLSTLFWILTMWAYVRYAEKPETKRYLLVVLFLGLGLMSKPMLVTLPLVLLLLDYWPLRRHSGFKVQSSRFKVGSQATDTRSTSMSKSTRRAVWEKAPLLGMAAISSIITFSVQGQSGAVGSWERFPLGIRAANAVVSYVRYIGKTLWPQNLAVFYPHPLENLPAWQVVGSALLIVVVSVLVLRGAKRRPYVAVGWLWYLGTLVPVLGVVQVGTQAMADRYTYVPLIGLFVIAAWGTAGGETEKGRKGEREKSATPKLLYSHTPLLAALAVLVIAVLSFAAWRQVGYWHDNETLFKHAIRVTENNSVAHTSLGLAYAVQGRADEALREYRKAIQIDPANAKAHNNLAVVLYFKGDYAGAWEEVHLSEEYGLEVQPGFRAALSQAMPEP